MNLDGCVGQINLDSQIASDNMESHWQKLVPVQLKAGERKRGIEKETERERERER